MSTTPSTLASVALAALLASGAALAQTAAPADSGPAPRVPAADAGDRAAAPGAGPVAPPGAGRAMPPDAGRVAPPPSDAGAPTATVTGKISRWLPNPNGEVDGLLLDDGTQVSFPTHLSTRVLAVTKVGDSVQVTGPSNADAASPRVIRATQIRSSASGQAVADDRSAGSPPPVPHEHAALTAMKESGRITQVLRTGRGDVNGVVLDSGTVVRFPPHAGNQFASLLKPSGALFAQGYGTRVAQGSAFEATGLGASESAVQTVFPGPRGPAGGPAGPGATPPPPGADRTRPGPDAGMPPPLPRPGTDRNAPSAPR